MGLGPLELLILLVVTLTLIGVGGVVLLGTGVFVASATSAGEEVPDEAARSATPVNASVRTPSRSRAVEADDGAAGLSRSSGATEAGGLADFEALLAQVQTMEDGGHPDAADEAALRAVLASAAAADDARDEGRAWGGSWQGHEMVLQTCNGQHSLHIDGQLAAAQSTDGSVRLEGEIDSQPVIGSFQMGPDRRTTLNVGDASVRLQRRPYDVALAPPPSDPSLPRGTEPSGTAAPDDPRWPAIVKLVAQIQVQGDDVASLATQSQVALRTLLLRITEAEEANASHRVLSGSDDPRLLRLIEHHEAQVARLIEALRELHVGSVEDQAGPDSSSRLLADLEVELAHRRR